MNRPVNKLEWSSFSGAAVESIYLGAGSGSLKHKFSESAAAFGD